MTFEGILESCKMEILWQNVLQAPKNLPKYIPCRGWKRQKAMLSMVKNEQNLISHRAMAFTQK